MATMEVVPGLEGIPIAESAVSRVDGQAGKLEYRGMSVEALAEHSSFEETSFLLLFSRLPTATELAEFHRDLLSFRKLKYKVVDLIKALPETGHPMEALQAAIAAIGMFYSRGLSNDDQSRRISCLRLIAKMPTVVSAFERLRHGDEDIQPRHDLSHAGNFLYMLTGEDPDPIKERILDVCLILHADHTMNASTFAGRVVGSTLSTPFSVVSSALGALYGPLHGGANEQAMALFDRIGTPENAEPVIRKMIDEKQKVPGYGHRVYKVIDPRAKVLKEFARQLTEQSGSPTYRIAVDVERICSEHFGPKGIWPNVDFFSGIIYRELGFPTDNFTPIFAVSRVSGWLAHWLEQLHGNRIYRPTQKYVGARDVPYVPIDRRG
jgi:citrate synthase